ncbi:hypothetical protein FOZ63_014955 [Perkinsus olseni]|uniref:Uncharacterized protein n=1 Tax=Perkinsus olseni TaxID=32597 RepID=A0A7J6RZQ3_PEROL|nr:hypothetical protein FOZ62_015462 [Perkinsus olseni]KAF4747450.1 hypothetical protein FOZ63_014955 [Perkinsus olseni]
MFRSHLIIGSDGSENKLDAHPAYPKQYIMTTTTSELVTVHSLRNGESFWIGSAVPQPHRLLIKRGGSLSLEEDGWSFHSTVVVDGARQHSWVKYGFKGVDSATGFNHSYAHEANLASDTWTLTMDEHDERPSKLVASNSKHGHVHHQVVVFTNFEKKDGSLTSEEAAVQLYNSYRVRNHRAHGASRRPMYTDENLQALQDAAGSLLSGHIPSDPGRLVHSVGWLSEQHHSSTKLIKYFDHEAGTAAAKYFAGTGGSRRLFTFNFQYPRGCEATVGTSGLCIAIHVSAANQSYAAGYFHVHFPNVVRSTRGAILDISLTMRYNPFALDLSLHGNGCSVVFRLGSTVSFGVTVWL